MLKCQEWRKNHNYELCLVKATCLASGSKFSQSFLFHKVFIVRRRHICALKAKQGFLTRLILIVKVNSKMKE